MTQYHSPMQAATAQGALSAPVSLPAQMVGPNALELETQRRWMMQQQMLNPFPAESINNFSAVSAGTPQQFPQALLATEICMACTCQETHL